MGLADGVAWERENEEVSMGNKVGELIVDWDALEVGDQAVFEGFNNQALNYWDFTVGKVYTVGVDEDGDKGFIDDEYLTPESHYDGAFNFRLTHKISDTVKGGMVVPFPDFSFKIRNGDNLTIRHWLKDNGVVWCDGDEDMFAELDQSQLYVESLGKVLILIDEDTPYATLHKFNEAPEISINIQPAVVTGWEIVENISEKELQLKEKIAKLTTELEKAQEELNNL